MNTLRMLDKSEEADEAEVTWEDQQRINTFSKLVTRLKRIEETLEELKEQKEALDDLTTELELADEEEQVLYKVGEAFLHIPHPAAMKRLEKDQQALNFQLSTQRESAEKCENEMKELKLLLYGKFGRSINLDD